MSADPEQARQCMGESILAVSWWSPGGVLVVSWWARVVVVV